MCRDEQTAHLEAAAEYKPTRDVDAAYSAECPLWHLGCQFVSRNRGNYSRVRVGWEVGEYLVYCCIVLLRCNAIRADAVLFDMLPCRVVIEGEGRDRYGLFVVSTC